MIKVGHRVAYESKNQDQQPFTISEVAAELTGMSQWCCSNGKRWTHGAAITNTPPPQPAILGLHPYPALYGLLTTHFLSR